MGSVPDPKTQYCMN